MASYLFDWEKGIALDAMKWNRATSLGEGEVSFVFLSCRRNLGYILELLRGLLFETRVCSVTSGILSSYDGHLRDIN